MLGILATDRARCHIINAFLCNLSQILIIIIIIITIEIVTIIVTITIMLTIIIWMSWLHVRHSFMLHLLLCCNRALLLLVHDMEPASEISMDFSTCFISSHRFP